MTRRPVLSLAAPLRLCLALVLSAPVAAEPRPGTVAGLDLRTPAAAADSFARAWEAGDFFVAWLALDPALRARFEHMVMSFEFAALLGPDRLPDGFFDRFMEHAAESADPDGIPGILTDRFAEFAAMMQAAREIGLDPFADLAPSGAAGAAGGDLARAALEGGGALVLRRSAAGRWRVAGVEGRDLPALWLFGG